MPKDVSSSALDSLKQAGVAITEAMYAPDAGPLMPLLSQLHVQILQAIQRPPMPGQQMAGQHQGQPGGPPGMGGPPQQGPPPGGPQQGPPPGGPPGPAAGGMPSAPGQGLFPNSPQPNAGELQQLLSSKAGM